MSYCRNTLHWSHTKSLGFPKLYLLDLFLFLGKITFSIPKSLNIPSAPVFSKFTGLLYPEILVLLVVSCGLFTALWISDSDYTDASSINTDDALSEHGDGYDSSSVDVFADGAPLAIAAVATLGTDIDTVVNATGAPAFRKEGGGWIYYLCYHLNYDFTITNFLSGTENSIILDISNNYFNES